MVYGAIPVNLIHVCALHFAVIVANYLVWLHEDGEGEEPEEEGRGQDHHLDAVALYQIDQPVAAPSEGYPVTIPIKHH